MLRRAFVLLGLAVLLSLFFPVAALLRQGGIDAGSLWMPGVDLVVLCAVIAVLPAMLLADRSASYVTGQLLVVEGGNSLPEDRGWKP